MIFWIERLIGFRGTQFQNHTLCLKHSRSLGRNTVIKGDLQAWFAEHGGKQTADLEIC